MSGLHQNQKYAHLDQMSTQDLEALLHADMECPGNVSTDMILYIMEVIRQREESAADKSDVARAQKEFYDLYHTPEGIGRSVYPAESPSGELTQTDAGFQNPIAAPNNHLRLRHIVAIAAIIAVLLLFMIPSVLGYSSIFQMIGQWTDDIFHFMQNSDAATNQSNVNRNNMQCSSIRTYENLQEALDSYEITEAVIPSEIPAGFELLELGVEDHVDNGITEFYATYKKSAEDAYLFINIRRWQNYGDYTIVEKDGNPVKEYPIGDITYYLFENLGQVTAAYYVDDLECIIYADISMDELIEMIESIE